MTIDSQWKLQHPRPSRPFYNLGLGMTALLMIILPLVYVGLMASTLLMAWQLVQWVGPMISHIRRLDGILLVLLVPLIPLVLFVFMLKPLLPLRRPKRNEVEVFRADHPELFSLIDSLVNLVGAPAPVAVFLTPDINASAALRPGLVNFFQRKLELRIGYPLLQNLSQDQLAGVLAHEFGHFSQGWGMRLTVLIHSVNLWFARAVYERDGWDQALVDFSNSGRVFTVLGYLARALVWVGRLLLQGLMLIGRGTSAFFSRQMEYDADFWEGMLVGAEGHKKTSEALGRMSLALNTALNKFQPLFQQRQRPGNIYPHLAQGYREDLAPAEGTSPEKTGFFDTHPSDESRYRRLVKIFPEGGHYRESRPALALLNTSEPLERQLTVQLFNLLTGGLGDLLTPVEV